MIPMAGMRGMQALRSTPSGGRSPAPEDWISGPDDNGPTVLGRVEWLSRSEGWHMPLKEPVQMLLAPQPHSTDGDDLLAASLNEA